MAEHQEPLWQWDITTEPQIMWSTTESKEGRKLILTLEIPAGTEIKAVGYLNEPVPAELAPYASYIIKEPVKITKIQDYAAAMTEIEGAESIFKGRPIIKGQKREIWSYAWLSLRCAQMTDIKKITNGLLENWDIHGRKMHEVRFVDGKKDGVEIYYRDNEQPSRKIEWVKGRKNGIEEEFKQDGTLNKRFTYKNNWVTLEETFHPNGQKIREVPYKRCKKDGSCKIWDEEGTLTGTMLYKKGEIVMG